MKTNLFNLVWLMLLLPLIILGCRDSAIDADTTDVNKQCEESNILCKTTLGLECINGHCNCPDGTYYLGNDYPDSVNVCPSLTEAHYVLDTFEGEAKSFKYLKAYKTDLSNTSIEDSITIDLYPTTLSEYPYDEVPIRLVFDSILPYVPGSGVVEAETRILAPFYPFNMGVEIPDKELVFIKWKVVSSFEYKEVSAEFYSLPSLTPLNKSMKLHYKRYSR